MHEGAWQSTLGVTLAGRTLGLLGLGRIGRQIAAYGQAFGMPVIAWSQNLTEEATAAVGVRRVEWAAIRTKGSYFRAHMSCVTSARTWTSGQTSSTV